MVAMTQNQNFKSSGHRKRHSVQFSHPMDYSTPGFPVHHQLPELNQTQVHRVSDVIQPFHPLMSPIPPAFSLSKHQGLFKWVSSSYQVAKVLGLQFFFFNFFTFHFIFFPFIFISWRLITLQYCSGFCHTLTWISHGFTCVPLPDLPSHLPLHPITRGFSFNISLSN